MDNYEKSYQGNIVIVTNLVFNKNLQRKSILDHAWKKGRPCIILYTDEDYDYLVPLKSEKPRDNIYKNVKKEYYELSEKSFLNLQSGEKIGVIHLADFFKKKTSGYKIIGKLTKEAYLEILKKFSEYHKSEIEEMVRKERKR